MSQGSLSHEPDTPDSQELVGFLVDWVVLVLSWFGPLVADQPMLIITLPLFEPLILDALQQHFTSFSTVYMHTSSPPPHDFARSVQGLRRALNSSRILYTPGYPSTLSKVSS